MQKPDITPEPLMRAAGAYMVSSFLFTANEIGLFAALGDGPLGVDELAARVQCPARTVRIVANALVASGLLAKEGERFRNTPETQTFLAGKTPADLRAFLRFWNRLSMPKWLGLEKSVRTGEAQRTGDFGPEEQKIFNEGVAAITTGSAMALAHAVDWSKHKRVLDLGGGTGNFLAALFTAHPNLSGTLFDLPGATAVARKALAGHPTAGRIEIVDGDLLAAVPYPKGHDALVMANIVHGFSAENCERMLKSARAAVDKGARLYVVDFWLDASRTDPAFGALMSGEFLIMTGEGETWAENDFAAWAGRTGWKIVERKPLTGPASVIVAEAA